MTDKQLFYEELVREVKEDFAARREMRRPYELTWQLNMNFLMGNQFCNITGRGEIEQDEKITAVIPLAKDTKGYIAMATRNGLIKKTALEEFENIRKVGKVRDKCRNAFQVYPQGC